MVPQKKSIDEIFEIFLVRKRSRRVCWYSAIVFIKYFKLDYVHELNHHDFLLERNKTFGVTDFCAWKTIKDRSKSACFIWLFYRKSQRKFTCHPCVLANR